MVQVLANLILLVASIDQFMSFDPDYEVVPKLIFSVPVSIYILSSKWEELFVAKTPIDVWVMDGLFRING